ncbi:MAG: hypothetical protein JSR87_10090 [Proteobacteria bacterium]|nr:hypothetical protein [Pseudomonadota bacterium]MBS0574242.1 hypothetical protein [Pseudomonadota bacterium]
MRPKIATAALAVACFFSGAAGAFAASLLTDAKGMTLYTFDADSGGKPSCYKDCAAKWPPYLGKKGEAMKKDWNLVKRTDGKMQWTYDGKPLYFFAGDKAKGDMKGDGLGGKWHVIKE